MALNRLLKETEGIRKELEERKIEQQSILQKPDALLQGLEQEKDKATVTVTDVRLLFGLETEKIKKLFQEYDAAAKERKGWSLFSSDLKAHASKIVFETVCKWIGIIIGGFYLLHSIVSVWRK